MVLYLYPYITISHSINMTSSIQSLPYLFCPSHNQQLSMICLQTKCIKNILICPICQIEQHQMHQIVPLRQYLAKIGSANQKVNVWVMEELGKVEEIRRNVRKDIQGLKERVVSQLEQFQLKIAEYFNSIQSKLIQITSINNPKHLQKTLHRIHTEQSPQSLSSLLNHLRLYSGEQANIALKYYSDLTRDKMYNFKNEISSMRIEEHFEKIKKMFGKVKEYGIKAKEYGMKANYFWSGNKGSKIKIQGLVATQESTSNGERFALAQSNVVGGDIVVGFRIKKIKGWVGVGICLKNAIIKMGYKFNYTMNYHGSYLISANGYCWSHSQPQMNSALKSSPFVQDDVIKVIFSPESNKITFVNMTKNCQFSMKTIDPPLNDMYVPCINICNHGDEVEIVNDIE